MLIPKMMLMGVDIHALRMVVPISRVILDIAHDTPGRKGDMFDLTIYLDTLKVRRWPKGYGRACYFVEVADKGTYQLLNVYGDVEAELKNVPVPDFLPRYDDDFLNLRVTIDGTVSNWEPTPKEIAKAFGWVIRG
jgi:hypothetical protein